MFKLSLLSFGVAAVLGLTLAVRHFTLKGLPLPLALAHGFFGAAGLVLLAVAAVKESFPGHTGLALALFIVTALGGFTLYAMSAAKRELVSTLIVIHGSAAVVSFLILLSSALSA